MYRTRRQTAGREQRHKFFYEYQLYSRPRHPRKTRTFPGGTAAVPTSCGNGARRLTKRLQFQRGLRIFYCNSRVVLWYTLVSTAKSGEPAYGWLLAVSAENERQNDPTFGASKQKHAARQPWHNGRAKHAGWVRGWRPVVYGG